MSEPIVYGPAFSTYVRSVRLALEEKHVPYRLEEVDMLKGAHTEPAHRARHPFAKVPAFEHDGFTLYETPAILRYVDEAFDGIALQPADVRDRARMMRAISIVDSYAYGPMIGTCVIQRALMPMLGNAPDEAAVTAALPKAEGCLKVLDGLLVEGPYLAGGALSLADLHLIPVYDYFTRLPEGQAMAAGTPNLAAWWGRVAERPSVTKTRVELG